MFFFFLKNEGCVCVWWFMQSESFQIFARVSHPMWNMYRDRCPRLNGAAALWRAHAAPSTSPFSFCIYICTHSTCVWARGSHTPAALYPSYQEEEEEEEIGKKSLAVRFGRLGVAACLIIAHHRRFIPLESNIICIHLFFFSFFFSFKKVTNGMEDTESSLLSSFIPQLLLSFSFLSFFLDSIHIKIVYTRRERSQRENWRASAKDLLLSNERPRQKKRKKKRDSHSDVSRSL